MARVSERVRRLLGTEPLAAPALGGPLGLDDLGSGERWRRRRRGSCPRGPGQTARPESRRRRWPDRDDAPDRGRSSRCPAAAASPRPPRVIHRRDVPRWLGSPPNGRPTFVARTTFVTPPPGERLAHDLLRLAAGVDVGGVDDIDPGVQSAVDDLDARVVIGVASVPEHHRAQAQLADPRRRCVPGVGSPWRAPRSPRVSRGGWVGSDLPGSGELVRFAVTG